MKGTRTYEVVARSSECLHDGHLVSVKLVLRRFATGEMPYDEESYAPHDREVEDERDKHPEYGANIRDNVSTLVCKKNEDGVQQADQGHWTEDGEEFLVEELLSCNLPYPVTGHDPTDQRYTEILQEVGNLELLFRTPGQRSTHNQNRDSSLPIPNMKIRLPLMPNAIDKKECEWRI